MVAMQKPIWIVSEDGADTEIHEMPYALECVRSWAIVAGGSMLALLVLSFLPDAWARAWGCVAGMVGALSIVAMVLLFTDHVNGVALLRDDTEEGDF